MSYYGLEPLCFSQISCVNLHQSKLFPREAVPCSVPFYLLEQLLIFIMYPFLWPSFAFYLQVYVALIKNSQPLEM